MRARRLPVIDEYVDGDQMAVFVNGQVSVLSAVATAALMSVGREWTWLTAVTTAVVGAAGPPPEGSAEEMVASVLAQLEDIGLIELNP